MSASPTPATPLRIGLSLPTWPLRDRSYASWPQIRSLARDAEALGVDTLWAPDHLQRSLPGEGMIGFWEVWTIITAVAEATSRVEIGPFVACTGFRNPALLAKMAATLDEVSGGRVVLGLGSGVPDRDDSWRAFGYSGERHVTRYAESVEITTRMLRERAVTVRGELLHVDAAEIIPRGPRPDGVPVWVAALGQRTARVAARWGDAINVNRAICSAADVEAVRRIAADACDAEGRDPTTLGVTGWARVALDERGNGVPRDGYLAGTPAQLGEQVRAFHAAGIAHLTFHVGTEGDPSRLPALTAETLARFAPVLEAIRTG
jgi:alkanesulfonate monooxygenase SsuD/methylene tetrahydromethanopterin reductase-like flavin-dependent oxidoreductase (luciferase family)